MDTHAQPPPGTGRPQMPAGYGIQTGTDGQLPWIWAVERLAAARNYWIATTSPGGAPHVIPVWGVWLYGAVCFGTDREARKARNLAASPAVAVHLESGDEVVILYGRAEEVTDPELIRWIDAAYEAKYGMAVSAAPGDAMIYAVRPKRALGWHEASFSLDATRWLFDDPASAG